MLRVLTPRWDYHTVIEYTHRLLAVTSGSLALAMAVVAMIGLARGRLADARGAAWASIALAPAFVAQGALGGWVVRRVWTPRS